MRRIIMRPELTGADSGLKEAILALLSPLYLNMSIFKNIKIISIVSLVPFIQSPRQKFFHFPCLPRFRLSSAALISRFAADEVVIKREKTVPVEFHAFALVLAGSCCFFAKAPPTSKQPRTGKQSISLSSAEFFISEAITPAETPVRAGMYY